MYKLLKKCFILTTMSFFLIECNRWSKNQLHYKLNETTESNSNENITEEEKEFGLEFLDMCLNIELHTHRISYECNKYLYDYFQERKRKNMLFSPHCVIISLSSIKLGTSGSTDLELSHALRFFDAEFEDEHVFQAHHYLLSCFPIFEYSELKIINAVFMSDYELPTNTYMAELDEFYNGFVARFPFSKEPFLSTEAINNYIANETRNAIPRLFPNTINNNTEIIFASTLYYNALWLYEFKKTTTRNAIFYAKKKNITVKMMSNRGIAGYLDVPSIQAECLYLNMYGNETFITIVLPYKNQTLDDVIRILRYRGFEENATNIRYTTIHYKIPRMNLTFSEDITEPIEEGLEFNRVFGRIAEIRKMVQNEGTKITNIVHGACFKVNEKGAGALHPLEEIPVLSTEKRIRTEMEFNVNRPFLFLVRGWNITSILLMGCVNNPNSD